MYENLVKRLRTVASAADFFGRIMPAADNQITKLCTEAADAIEDLQAQNNELLFRCGQAEALIDYYQTGKLLSNEPPKEDEHDNH